MHIIQQPSYMLHYTFVKLFFFACHGRRASWGGIKKLFSQPYHLFHQKVWRGFSSNDPGICEAGVQPKECFATEQNRLSLLYFFGSFSLGGGRMAGTAYSRVISCVSALRPDRTTESRAGLFIYIFNHVLPSFSLVPTLFNHIGHSIIIFVPFSDIIVMLPLS